MSAANGQSKRQALAKQLVAEVHADLLKKRLARALLNLRVAQDYAEPGGNRQLIADIARAISRAERALATVRS